MGPLLMPPSNMPPVHPAMSPQPPGSGPSPRPTFPAYQQVQQLPGAQASPAMEHPLTPSMMMMGAANVGPAPTGTSDQGNREVPKVADVGPGCKLMHPEEDLSLVCLCTHTHTHTHTHIHTQKTTCVGLVSV